MCGICGILHVDSCEHNIEKELSKSLKSLRHRGYDGCGISINMPYQESLSRRRIVSTKQFLKQFKSPRIISQLLDDSKCCKCEEYRICGLAHTRYKTAGDCSLENTQPVFNDDMTMGLVHNGQIEVFSSIDNSKEQIFDSKYILQVFEKAFKQTQSIFRSINVVHNTVNGAYACILMIKDLGIVGFRDPRGIRPLAFGTEQDNIDLDLFEDVKNIKSAIFASESAIMDDLEFKFIRDVKPGESIFIDLKGNVHYGNYGIAPPPKDFVLCGQDSRLVKYTPCLFEYIYLADENSIIDGIRVGRAREIMGELMHDRLKRYFKSIEAIAPIPNTPVNATKKLSEILNIKYVDLLYLPSMKQLEISNNDQIPSSESSDDLTSIEYIKNAAKTSRTFILPTQNKRKLAVKDKFRINVDSILDCQGKIIALVDDSIVRGTTMSVIVKMIKELVQPKKLILVSLAPPIKYENFYGIDISDRNTLIAHNRTSKEIARELGADEVMFGDLDVIIQAFKKEARKNGVEIDGYEHSVFKNI